MKFKTKRTSETGKKFLELEKELRAAKEATLQFIDEIGAEAYRPGYFSLQGGIGEIYFPKGYEIPKYFKKSRWDGYVPNLKYKQGKILQAKINKLPTVRWDKANACIGYEAIDSHIGYSFQHPDYILYTTKEKWNCPTPDDCEEITTTEFNELSNVENLTKLCQK